MDALQIWLQPIVLLTAFIFFWREAKLGRNELKEDVQRMESHLREDMRNMESRMMKGLNKMETRIDRLDACVARIKNIMLGQSKAN